MARKPSVWFREQDGWFYTTLGGNQIKLSKDAGEAEREFHALLAKREGRDEPKLARVSLRKLCDEFLEWAQKNTEPDTYRWRKRALQCLLDHLPKGLKAAELTVRQAEKWVEAQDTWGHNTRVAARAVLHACMNWGVKHDLLKENPVRKLEMGSYRNTERILSPEEREQVRGAMRGQEFKDYLRVLELTGARPFSEIAALTGQMIDFDAGVIEFGKHKNSKKGKKRTVYLVPELEAILRRRIAERPGTRLFLSAQGEPIDSKSVSHRLRGAAKRLSLKPFTVYAYRHTYITEALERGLTASVVAELVGNSAKTIEKYYDHLDQKKTALKAAALRAVC